MASITHRLAALNLRRSTDADFTLVCQGTEVKAHSFVLAVWSDYFESAQSGSWVENISKRIEFKDFTAEALAIAVDFMYGIPIPENFKEGGELLRLADLLMMETLKLEAGDILVGNLTTENYLEASQTAEMYYVENLVTSCAKFVFENVREVNWEEMEKLSKVMSAFVKIAKEEKEKTGKLNIKIRKEGAKELEKHILVVLNLSRNVVMVRACVNEGKIVEGDVGVVVSQNVKDFGALVHVDPSKEVVTVNWVGKGLVDVSIGSLERIEHDGSSSR